MSIEISVTGETDWQQVAKKPRLAHSINILEMPRNFSRSLQKKIVPACRHLGFSRKKTILDRILIRIGS